VVFGVGIIQLSCCFEVCGLCDCGFLAGILGFCGISGILCSFWVFCCYSAIFRVFGLLLCFCGEILWFCGKYEVFGLV